MRKLLSTFSLLAVASTTWAQPEASGLSPSAENRDAETAGGTFELASLYVTADAFHTSEGTLLNGRQNGSRMRDGIGAEAFSRLSLGDAGEALSRVTGASVVDGKYAVIRGMGDRYTNTLMNDLMLPSADPDRRAVQLDQFPTGLLESVVATKSFTPDQPGSFSGGSINLETKRFPEQRFVKMSYKLGFNTNVVGDDLLTVPGGGRDWTGTDDGTRDLPGDFPERLDLTVAQARRDARAGDFSTATELDRLTKDFHNRPFYPARRSGEPDMGLSFAIGDRIAVKEDGALGYVWSFNYDRSSSHYGDGIVGRYSEGRRSDYESAEFVDVSRIFSPDTSVYNFAPFIEAGAVPPGGAPEFGVTRSAFNVDWGTLAQVSYKPNDRHEVTARYFYNQSAADVIKRGVGEASRSDSGGEFRENIDLLYTERSIASAQLEGSSALDGLHDGATLQWRAAHSRSTQDQPDYRSLEFKWSYIFNDYDPSGVFQNRYFRYMEDDNLEGAADVIVPFTVADGRRLKLKFGGLHSQGERSYRGRQFQIQNFSLPRNDPEAAYERIRGFPNPVGLLAMDEGAGTVEFGSVMRETDSNINYEGEQDITAGYAMADWEVLDDWRAIFGMRYEATDLSTAPKPTSNIRPINGVIDEGHWLPAVSIVHQLKEGMNLRASYGRTVARPTYRELAAVRVYEPFADEFYEGNPLLEMTVIDNYDLRWEYFVRSGEVIAVSLFYKDLSDAIEQTFESGAIQPRNVDDGRVYGVELEYRQALETWSEALKGFTVGLNLAWIESEVAISEQELQSIRELDPGAEDKRPLYGQSEYIINADVSWFVEDWLSTFTLSYNIFGERLDLVTTGPLPDVYEQPAATLDFTASKLFRHGWSVRFSAENLLNPDFGKTLTHEGTDFHYESYRRGRSFSLSVAKEF